MKLRIAGGRVIDPKNGVDGVADVYVCDGRVAAVGDSSAAPVDFAADKTIDARGKLVLPGLIDLRARLMDCGEGGGVESETRAAAAGGITRAVCPPDTQPVVDTPAMAHLIRARAAACGQTRIHPLGALTAGLEGRRLADMALLADAGCVGVGNALRAVENTLLMRRAMQYASTYDLPVFGTPRDAFLHGNGVVHEGEISTRLGLPAIPEAAETVGVARDLALIETSGARAHFELLSCARAVEMLAEAVARGLPVTAGAAVHQLHLHEGHIGAFDTQCKTYPPLRTPRDREALVAGVADGSVAVICSDHRPHEADAKLAPFVEAAAGISGVETLLPMVMRLAEEGKLGYATAVAAVTANPAAIIGMAEEAGHLGVGAIADACVYDPAVEWRLTAEGMLSRGKNSPWLGEMMRGKVTATVIGGEVVFERGGRLMGDAVNP